MRLHYYRFPEDTDQMTRFNEGCAVILKNGNEIHPETIPEDKWPLIECIDDTLGRYHDYRSEEIAEEVRRLCMD